MILASIWYTKENKDKCTLHLGQTSDVKSFYTYKGKYFCDTGAMAPSKGEVNKRVRSAEMNIKSDGQQ